jgi:nucleoside-diphosphate-sugar epimerase
MRYAMTGATGFLGGVLARQLRDSGHDVVALVRDPAKATPLQDLGVELVVGDLDDTAALDQLLSGADGFFHVAGWYKHGRREHEMLNRVNVAGTRNALDAAKRAGTPRTVYTSTTAINSDTKGAVHDEGYHHEGPWAAEYDRTKWEAHQIAHEYADGGLDVVIVQPGVIYGPGDTGSTLGQLTRQILAGKMVLGPRDGSACWGHVEDIAHGHVLAMEKGRAGESYYLTGDVATYAQVFRQVKELAGSKSRLVFLPNGLVKANAALTAPLERVIRLPQSLTADAARAGCATYLADSTKARTELGWTSRPVADGIAETVRAELAATG